MSARDEIAAQVVADLRIAAESILREGWGHTNAERLVLINRIRSYADSVERMAARRRGVASTGESADGGRRVLVDAAAVEQAMALAVSYALAIGDGELGHAYVRPERANRWGGDGWPCEICGRKEGDEIHASTARSQHLEVEPAAALELAALLADALEAGS